MSSQRLHVQINDGLGELAAGAERPTSNVEPRIGDDHEPLRANGASLLTETIRLRMPKVAA